MTQLAAAAQGAAFPVLTQDGEEVPWVGLKLETGLANSTEQIDGNIEATLARGYVGYETLLGQENGTVSIVGSGPSLKENWQSIKDVGGDIIACNAALQFLLDKGVVPKYAMFFDADVLAQEFAIPHPDVIYLVASRCHPFVFTLLEKCKVIVWHAAGDLNTKAILEKHGLMEAMVGGGSAAVTRTMVLAPPMGYRDLHLWGADSSFADGATHIRKSTTEERTIEIMAWGRAFFTSPWMAQQAEDFKILAPQLRDLGIRIAVHGDGLIPHLARRMGLNVDGQSYWWQLWRDAIVKARILWSQL